MKANQVVIVMDREKAERWVSDAGQPDDLIENDIARALLRDPDELEARLAEAINEGTCRYWGAEHKPLDALSDRDREAAIARSRAVLAVLGEEGGPE